MSTRLLGQDTEILVVLNGVVQDTITAIKSFSFTYKFKKTDEGYIGETTNRKDQVFEGVEGMFDMHHETSAVWGLIIAIVTKAKTRLPGSKINVKTSYNYPDGSRIRVIIPECAFGDIPVQVQGRSDYVSSKFDFSASNANPI